MKTTDFENWLHLHRSAFPAIDAWLAKFPSDADKQTRGLSASTLTAGDVLRAWQTILSDVEAADAIEATRRLARGDEELPRSFDDYPRAVRRIARSIAGERAKAARSTRLIDGLDTYRCPLCRDTGGVTVWHPKSVAAMHRGTFGERGAKATALVRCSCDAGSKLQWCSAVFDADGWVVCSGVSDLASIERLEKFVEQKGRPLAMAGW
ncbi:MAG: hypothetical protein WD894_04995 [Pirellulales bacterium]